MRDKKNQFIQQHGSDVIVRQLLPYVTEQRKVRIETVIAGRLRGIQLAIEAPSDINNALAAVRTAEALGIEKVHIIAAEGGAAAAKGITQGAIYWVDVVFYQTWQAFIDVVRRQGLQLAGGTVTATIPLTEVSIDQPLCILVGNERRGLSDQAQKDCAIHYKVPMFGMTESFNLSVSAALSLYETTTRKRKTLIGNSDLLPAEQQQLRALYYLNSVSPRLIEGLLNKKKS